MKAFNKNSFRKACTQLANHHASIGDIITQYGHPPLFERAFSFDTLVQIILEQQVSLASGRAVFNRLRQRLGTIAPEGLLSLNFEELREVSVSRQKAGYLHHLSQMVIQKKLLLDEVPALPDEAVRSQLMTVKGIGPWTADVVLMLCLKRQDVFPLGDVALVNSVRHQLNQPEWTLQQIELHADRYRPFRTAAAYCYWHAYIKRKNIKTPV
jgi:DNA-3-methyladenine glycosylase II